MSVSRSTDALAASQVGLWSNPEVEMMVALESDLRARRGSPFEQLVDAIETHVVQEAASLAAYRQLADTASDAVVAMLMRLVLEDEERHHELMKRIVADLRDGLYWTQSVEALPDATIPRGVDSARALAAVHEFIREERDGVRQLQDLAHKSARINEGLDSLLLEMMAMDSQKHERILRFIERRLQAAAD
jgi:rubrerythrin